MSFAFRCGNTLADGSECGQLEPADYAGDNELPASCRICHKGHHAVLIPGIVDVPAEASAFTLLSQATPEQLAAWDLESDGAGAFKYIGAPLEVPLAPEPVAEPAAPQV